MKLISNNGENINIFKESIIMSKINLNRIFDAYDKKVAQQKIDDEKQKELNKARREQRKAESDAILMEWIEDDIKQWNEYLKEDRS